MKLLLANLLREKEKEKVRGELVASESDGCVRWQFARAGVFNVHRRQFAFQKRILFLFKLMGMCTGELASMFIIV
jgi:hypothetical protein